MILAELHLAHVELWLAILYIDLLYTAHYRQNEEIRIVIVILLLLLLIIIILKSFRKYVSNIPGNHEVKELPKTAILGTAHIFGKC